MCQVKWSIRVWTDFTYVHAAISVDSITKGPDCAQIGDVIRFCRACMCRVWTSVCEFWVKDLLQWFKRMHGTCYYYRYYYYYFTTSIIIITHFCRYLSIWTFFIILLLSLDKVTSSKCPAPDWLLFDFELDCHNNTSTRTHTFCSTSPKFCQQTLPSS